MQKNVDEIFAEIDRINEELKSITHGLPAELINEKADGDKWSIAEVIEHIAIVEDGLGRVCNKLLKKAKEAERRTAGTFELSENYVAKGTQFKNLKVEAPEKIRPTGTKTVGESLAALAESRQKLEQIRPLFAQYSVNELTFPHPFLGPLSASDWLDFIVEHKTRHLQQVERIAGEKTAQKSPGYEEG